MRKNIYVKDKTQKIIDILLKVEISAHGNFSGLVEYLLMKEYKYLQKYNKEKLALTAEEKIVLDRQEEQLIEETDARIQEEIEKLRAERKARKEKR